MPAPSSGENVRSRWPHRWAVSLVCATFPLIWVGGLVTTYDAGMAVPDWPATYGYNLFLYPWTTWWAGPWDLFIEHGHRLLAAGVGLLTIVWLFVVWRGDGRRWVIGYTLGCLALVIGQGVLGGLRVRMDAIVLARIHGCVGPLFFVACVLGAGITSDWWRESSVALIPGDERAKLARCARLAWLAMALAYGQLVLGAHLRHVSPNWPPLTFQFLVFGHLIGALALLSYAVWLRVCFHPLATMKSMQPCVRHASWLISLVVFQIALGTFVWRVKYQWPTWVPQPNFLQNHTVRAEGMLQVLTVTGHVAIGSLIFALAATVALRSQRLLGWPLPLASLRPAASRKTWGIVA